MAIVALSRKLGMAAAIGVVALTVASCGPTVATRGNLVADDRLGQIRPGVSTMNDVALTLGTPTTVSTFDDSTWYYIGQQTEKTAFFDPEIVRRRVVEIDFDDSGVVRDIRELGLDDAQQVELVERETPTLGRQITFMEQMLGNFGRGLGRVEDRRVGSSLPN